MSDLLQNLQLGFSVALAPHNLGFALIGSLLGTLIGVLPGLGPLATLAMLLPLTFYLSPDSALIMLAGIYYGAQYGGSTTAILVNLPGESSSLVTCIDGYQMSKQGRAGVALATAALASFFAGCVATVLVVLFAPVLSSVGLMFAPADYFALMVFGLVAVVVLAQGSLLKAFGMMFVGLMLGLIGTDPNSGFARYTFGIPQLYDGLSFVPLAMGMFGLGEIIASLSRGEEPRTVTGKIGRLYPNLQELREAFPAAIRGTGIGALLGIIPGGGAVLGSFAAYVVEKRVAKHPERMGRGAIQGVAAPEAANNAAAQTTFIPMLTLGIPPNAVLALLIGAMMIHGVQPGPQMLSRHPDVFWGLVASMWVANAMLLVINLPLIGVWVKLLSVPYRLLFPGILLFCAIGAFAENYSAFDVTLAAVFAAAGYTFRRLGCEVAPLILAFVLGPMVEEHFRRAMLVANGDPVVFFSRPISGTLLALAAFLLIIVLVPSFRRKREEAFQE